jgi:hypothetical protein
MNDDLKWIDWNKPETVVTKLAREIDIPAVLAKFMKPGTFKFNDGTTQGWKIDQFYDSSGKILTKIPPFTDPTTSQYYGLSLSNSQNLALAAGAYPLVVTGTQAPSLDFYLESPDLANDQDWQDMKGYSLDLHRNFLSYCGDLPGYFVQLQMQVWDKTKKTIRTFAEWDEKTETFIFNEVMAGKPYHFTWINTVLSDTNLVLRYLRIRCTLPHFSTSGSGECLPKGCWLFGNIGPE